MKGYFCTVCKRAFGRLSPFNAHKTGGFGDPVYSMRNTKNGTANKELVGYTKPTRRCLTDEEMAQKGMVLRDGLWRMEIKASMSHWNNEESEEEMDEAA